jgi:hypothetical protein
MVRDEGLYGGQLEQDDAVGRELGSRGIAIVRNRYQETSIEDIAGWKILSGCCSDL